MASAVLSAVSVVAPSFAAGSAALTDGVLVDATSGPTLTGYDVVGGDLDALRASGGDFAAATPSCIGPSVAGTSLDASATSPGPGSGMWFLVWARPGVGPLTYDAGSTSQWGSRDGEIASAGNCP